MHKCGFRLIQLNPEGKIVFPHIKHPSNNDHLKLDEDDPYFDRLDYKYDSRINKSEYLQRLDKNQLLDDYSKVESRDKLLVTNINPKRSKSDRQFVRNLLKSDLQNNIAKEEMDIGTIKSFEVDAKFKAWCKTILSFKTVSFASQTSC